MGKIVHACLCVGPHGAAVPIHLAQPREPIDRAVRGIKHIAVVQQTRINTDRPCMRYQPFHVQQIGGALCSKKCISIVGFGLIPEDHLSRALQPFVGIQRNDADHEQKNDKF